MTRITSEHPKALLVFVECRAERRGDRWLASCDALGVSDQGESWIEARARLRAALNLFFEDCSQRGVLEKVLDARKVEYTDWELPRNPSLDPAGKIQILTALAGEMDQPLDASPVEQLRVIVPAAEMAQINARHGAD